MKATRNLLGEVQFLIVLLSMVIMAVVVAVSWIFFSYAMLNELRAKAQVTADELESLLEYPLYNVDNQTAIRIAKAFVSSGKISGIELRATASGQLFSEVSGKDSSRIPAISRVITSNNMDIGSFTIAFSDEEISKSQQQWLLLSLIGVVSVLIANIAASRFIGGRVLQPFQTIITAIGKLAEGDYKAKIKPTRYQDINILVKLFNHMAARINRKNLQQQRVEKSLQAERQFLVDIIDFLPDATFMVDNQHRVVLWNRAAEELTGISRDEVIGKGDYIYSLHLTGQRKPILIDLLDDLEATPENTYTFVKRTEKAIYGEFFVEQLNGREGLHLWVVAAPTYDSSGKRSGAIEMIRDITDFREAEKERAILQEQLSQTQKMESVGRLAGGIAHDFNNMITVILGHAQIAQLTLPQIERLPGHLKAIEDTAYRSTDLVKQLLAFARQQTISPKTININDTVAKTLSMVQRLIGENVEVEWTPAQKLWEVYLDPVQVDQIIINLCVNARDAIDGIGRITLATANIDIDEDYCHHNRESRPGQYVMLAVSDDGCGMSKETLDRIFEPFFTTKEIGKGTGMGLATVYGIVKQNKGFINVSSEPGKGSLFQVYLPRHSERVEVMEERPVVGDTSGKGELVLLVEDDGAILEIGKEMLEQLGYRVIAVNSAVNALENMKKHGAAIQLLITDVVMPGMNGRDLEQLLRATRPDLKCLFISGYTADVIAHHGVLDKDVYFLQKPFSLQDLARTVRQAIG